LVFGNVHKQRVSNGCRDVYREKNLIPGKDAIPLSMENALLLISIALRFFHDDL
jgi:hypothetical protein